MKEWNANGCDGPDSASLSHLRIRRRFAASLEATSHHAFPLPTKSADRPTNAAGRVPGAEPGAPLEVNAAVSAVKRYFEGEATISEASISTAVRHDALFS